MQIIEAVELKKRIEAGEKINLLDVRQSEEHTEFNIGGTLIPLGNVVAMQTEDIDHLKDEEVICYCRSGQRSMQASMMLENMGFKNIKNLAGGMLNWQALFGK